MSSYCQDCAGKLLFSERVAWPQTYCWRCATVRGLRRICDHDLWLRFAADAAQVPPWWRWTVYLYWAMIGPRRAGGPT